ncbi:XRE family transcriptional regulator [Phytohabitans sp. ZYX-F-186]|uniref:XRE family transcriptional regulator n=1 Tax=Phytohabitans maris TaxID=3071409 RepID=A0ABU0Z9U0_9ACTN|nr:XRE family transcriptional regulator [Phytohabitans sp. ZYX-F-186]MDQ7903813.1 XRE family transcriptional regulator [Phytohabitans sp. ZYX-F-186]
MASPAVPPIGARLRAERRRRGVSIRGLARDIGVSASLISQIETEKSSPSVSTLYAISTALGISIEELFGPPTAEEAAAGVEAEDAGAGVDGAAGEPAGAQVVRLPAFTPSGEPSALLTAALAAAAPRGGLPAGGVEVAGRRVGPVITPEEREVLTLDSGVTWELLGRMPHKHVEFLLITYQPGGTSSSSGLLMRHTGIEFGFVISGELTLSLGFESHKLRPGDAVSFDSSNPHAYRNESTEPAVGVWFVLERWS